MKVGWFGRGIGGVTWFLLAACGGTDNGSPAGAGASGAANQAGSASEAGNGTSTAGAGGSTSVAGSTGVAGSNHAGEGALDCSGAFGMPAEAMPRETGIPLGSPTLSPDELELIYARKPTGQIEFRRSLRTSTSAAFPIGSPIPALDAACQPGDDRSVDLSRDGLRAYVACYAATGTPVGPATLHVAQRTAVGQDFTLLAGTSMIAPSAAISADELTLYTSSDVNPGLAPPRQYTRGALEDVFGSAADIPGLETLNVSAPDPSPDGLALYGGLNGGVVVSARPSVDMPFSAPMTLVAPTAALEQLGAPELSHDCRSLYYISQTSDTTTNMLTSVLLVVRR